MGEKTKISWTDHTSNPWVGCTVAHTGCQNCYARDFSQRKHGSHGAKASRPWALWGPGQDRYVTKGFWTDVPLWARAARKERVRRTLFASLMDPLDPEVYERDAAPEGVACRETFAAYMALLHNVVPEGPQLGGLIPLLLTKRPEHWRRIPSYVRANSWLIYSASDQPTLEDGMAHLRHAEGFAGLGLSLEPLVGPIAFESAWLKVLNWILIGGESGRNARPCDVAWIRAIVRQCREAGVSPYVKQMGARSYEENPTTCVVPNEAAVLARDASVGTHAIPGAVLRRRDPAGADPSEWPADVQVQERPEGLR